MSGLNSMQVALTLAVQQRDLAVQMVARAGKDLQVAEDQLLQLRNYQAESLDRWMGQAQSVTTPQIMMHHHYFMAKLEKAMDFQKNICVERTASLALAQKKLQDKEQRSAILKMACEKLVSAQMALNARRDQKASDEMAMTMHRMREQDVTAGRAHGQ
jgi:flagellar protein FliJ